MLHSGLHPFEEIADPWPLRIGHGNVPRVERTSNRPLAAPAKGFAVPQREYACDVSDLIEGRGREFVIAGRIVALFKVGEDVVALDGICPHAGGPLAQGMVRNEVVTCPWHGWQYQVRTGQHQLNPRICVESFRVTVDDGKVYVEV